MQKIERSPKNQAEFLMNEGEEILKDMDFKGEEFLSKMTRYLVEFGWVENETVPTKKEIDEEGLGAWMGTAYESHQDAQRALVLLAVVRGNSQASGLLGDLAYDEYGLDQDDLAGIWEGTHLILRVFGYV